VHVVGSICISHRVTGGPPRRLRSVTGILTSRSAKASPYGHQGEEARAEILARHPKARLEVCRVDLADLASVEEFADGLIADGTALDRLVNNAGVMAPPTR
jgi:NAD(P)-dependent dehydrogenase (short-subunit alcohol dehydrogenase family)